MCDMQIWSVKTEAKVVLQPEFFCPKCLASRAYQLKQISTENPFNAIPALGLEDFNKIVECQVCKNGFDPKVLKPSNQSLFRLVGIARNQLNGGISPQLLKIRLMSDGLNEAVVDMLITLAQY